MAPALPNCLLQNWSQTAGTTQKFTFTFALSYLFPLKIDQGLHLGRYEGFEAVTFLIVHAASGKQKSV